MTIYDLNGFDTIDFKVYAVQSDSEQSLLKKLKLLYKSTNPKHCDVSFKCSDGKSIYGHKVIMAIRSDYFDTLFRYEPNKTQFEVPQFDSNRILGLRFVYILILRIKNMKYILLSHKG